MKYNNYMTSTKHKVMLLGYMIIVVCHLLILYKLKILLQLKCNVGMLPHPL